VSHYQYTICMSNCTESMRNYNTRAVMHQLAQCILNQYFRGSSHVMAQDSRTKLPQTEAKTE
jgi:hypothetical protein